MTIDVHPATVGGLRTAIRSGSLLLEYEPVVDLDSGRIVSVEAFVRWPQALPHLKLGDLVTVAERAGLGGELGRWVLGQAIADLAAWHASWPTARTLTVAVAASPSQLRDPELVAVIRDYLDCHRATGSMLWLEISQRSAVTHGRPAGQLTALRDLGIRIAVDGMRGNYSHLARLDSSVVNEIKLDPSCTSRLTSDADRRGALMLTASLARYLGLELVVRGIESAEQVRCLRTLGGVMGQGRHFSPPLPAAAIPDLLRRSGTWRATGDDPDARPFPSVGHDGRRPGQGGQPGADQIAEDQG
jgi:EAL domain-containing protein (putative c-di-GMP-specific phosphodiesterase class I)